MTCQACGDSGWVAVANTFPGSSKLCACRTRQAPAAKFTDQDLDRTMSRLSMLLYWPSAPGTRAEIKAFLAKIVPSREALKWLTDQIVDHVGQWPGPAEIRGILDNRYRPADGKAGWSALPGFTPEEGEARYNQALPPLDAPLNIESARMIRQLADGKGMPA